ncbi:MAG: hypothetical protein ACLGIF_07365 [Actinomycetes bacterium]
MALGHGKDEDRSTEAETDGMPRWVKGFIVVAVGVVIVLVLAALLTGGQHSPGRHSGAGPVGNASQTLAEAGAVHPAVEAW